MISQREYTFARYLYASTLLIWLLQSAGTSHGQTACRYNASDVRAPDMIRIPGGTFLMGSPVTNQASFAYRATEKPQHEVPVDEFRMGRFLVTAEEFCQFLNDVGNNGYFVEYTGLIYDYRTIRKVDGCFEPQENAERSPAFPVTWVGASAYCEWLSRKFGRRFRLPTEAEWEFAARGVEGRLWPWGDETPVVPVSATPNCLAKVLGRDHPLISQPGDNAEYRATLPSYRLADSDKCIPFYELRGQRWSYARWDSDRPWAKAPVGSFPRNATPEGVYDVLGYLSGQWCSDAYVEDAYARRVAGETVDAKNADLLRVLRGAHQIPVLFNARQLPIRLLGILIPGDANTPQDTPGRTWSRESGKTGAIFRLAESARAPHQDGAEGGDRR